VILTYRKVKIFTLPPWQKNGLISILYAMAVVSIPWPNIFKAIYGYPFIDRSNYLNYILYRQSVLETHEFKTVLDFISGEYLWHYLIRFIVHQEIPAEVFFYSITVLSLTIFSYFLVSRHGIFSLFLLLNPLIIDLTFSQLRIALALSILLLCYIINKNYFTIIAIIISLLIHTASVLFILMFFYSAFLYKHLHNIKYGYYSAFLLLSVAGVIISLCIGPFREQILTLIGDRRALYNDMSSSLLYLSFWIFLFVIMGIKAKKYLNTEIQYFTVIILALVTVSPFTGAYSSRFIASSFPCLISTILINWHKKYGIFVLSIFMFYSLTQWLFWFRIF